MCLRYFDRCIVIMGLEPTGCPGKSPAHTTSFCSYIKISHSLFPHHSVHRTGVHHLYTKESKPNCFTSKTNLLLQMPVPSAFTCASHCITSSQLVIFFQDTAFYPFYIESAWICPLYKPWHMTICPFHCRKSCSVMGSLAQTCDKVTSILFIRDNEHIR